MIDNLMDNLEGMTAIDALDILIGEFNLGTYTICFQGTQRIVSLDSLLVEYHQIPGVLAKYISPIKFKGGPDIQMYTGSLLTLLCDCVLREWSTTGRYADLVEHVTI